MLGSVRIVNFKGLHDVTVPTGRLTVLVGPNGVGKTSVLEAIELVGQAATEARPQLFKKDVLTGRFRREWILRSGASELSVECALDGLTLALAAKSGAAWCELKVRDDGSKDQRILDATDDPHVERLRNVARLRFDPESMANSPVVSEGSPSLSADGSGLPTLLQYLHGLRDGTLERIEAAVRSVVPRFLRVQFRPVGVPNHGFESHTIDGKSFLVPTSGEKAGVGLFVEFEDGVVTPATHVSEGTLLTIALLTMAHASLIHGASLILIDDIDRALHPDAQFSLVEALREVLKTTPSLQIIATTHSPDFVDACEFDEVVVMGFDPLNGPVAAPLSAHPEAQHWRTLIRTGEFWGTIGEGWVRSVERAAE